MQCTIRYSETQNKDKDADIVVWAVELSPKPQIPLGGWLSLLSHHKRLLPVCDFGQKHMLNK